MKKKTIALGIILIAALSNCNNSKNENNNDTQTALAAPAGETEVDLANRGLDGLEVTIKLPDSLNSKIKYGKSEYTGSLDIMAGDNFKMILTSNWVSDDDTMDVVLKERIKTVKDNIDLETKRILVNETNVLLWEYTNDNGAKGYHFYSQSAGPKGTFYSFADNESVLLSEKTARAMIEIAKSVKQKVAPSEKQ